ncbi:hypothetical protein D3C73_838780 [compost metagenome]
MAPFACQPIAAFMQLLVHHQAAAGPGTDNGAEHQRQMLGLRRAGFGKGEAAAVVFNLNRPRQLLCQIVCQTVAGQAGDVNRQLSAAARVGHAR